MVYYVAFFNLSQGIEMQSRKLVVADAPRIIKAMIFAGFSLLLPTVQAAGSLEVLDPVVVWGERLTHYLAVDGLA